MKYSSSSLLYILSFILTQLPSYEALKLRQRSLVSPVVAEQFQEEQSSASPLLRKRPQVLIQATDFYISSQVALDDSGLYPNLSYLSEGDVLGVSLDVPATGIYRVEASVCNPEDKGSFSIVDTESFRILAESNALPITDNWNDWTATRLGFVRLEQGTSQLQMVIKQGGFNFRFLSFTLLDNLKPPPAALMASSFGIPAVASASTSGGVASEAPFGGPPCAGSIYAGSSMDYEIDGVAAGTYKLEVMSSSPTALGSLLVVDQNTHHVVGELHHVQDTNGWYTWSTSQLMGSLTVADEDAGMTLSLQLVALEGGFNLQYLFLRPAGADLSTSSSAPSSLPYYFQWAGQATQLGGVVLEEYSWSSEGGPYGTVEQLDDFDTFDFDFSTPVSAGVYQLSLRVASVFGGGAVEIIDQSTRAVLGTVQDLPTTGGWFDYETFVATETPLLLPAAESMTLEFRVLKGGWNLAWIALELGA